MAAGFSWRSPTSLFIVPPKTKITASYFIKHVFTPMFDVDIKKLNGKETGKVLLHMDKASSHTARKTANWLNSHKIKFIPKEEWLPNSPELSPIDYFANGTLKKMLKERKYSTGRGMIMAVREKWRKIKLEHFQNALLSWPKRVNLVKKARGHKVAL